MQTNSPSRDVEVDLLQDVDGGLRPVVGREGHPEVADRDLGRSFIVAAGQRPVAPADLVERLQAADQPVEAEADQADHHHAGDDQVVALAGVAGVDDQVAEPRVDGDHLGRDDDQPGDAQGDAQAGEDLRQGGREDHLAEEVEAGDAEVARGPDVDELDVLHRRHRRGRRSGTRWPGRSGRSAPASLTPNQRMATGIQAIGEIGRSTWMAGLKAMRARPNQPSSRPAGMPTSDRQQEARGHPEQRGHDVLEQHPLAGQLDDAGRPPRRGVGKMSLPVQRTARCQPSDEAGRRRRSGSRTASSFDLMASALSDPLPGVGAGSRSYSPRSAGPRTPRRRSACLRMPASTASCSISSKSFFASRRLP